MRDLELRLRMKDTLRYRTIVELDFPELDDEQLKIIVSGRRERRIARRILAEPITDSDFIEQLSRLFETEEESDDENL